MVFQTSTVARPFLFLCFFFSSYLRLEVNMAPVLSLSLTVSVACGGLALYVISRLLRGKHDRLPLPPGPKGLPVLGNINDLPKTGEPAYHENDSLTVMFDSI